ncbi:RNA-binding (RRM/RBD/RNP motifs) family protein [Euphorbia peplus]|nr:RNA-binding (RRM/RBD/RNP motifs) family protein [Euphorbia peplus]
MGSLNLCSQSTPYLAAEHHHHHHPFHKTHVPFSVYLSHIRIRSHKFELKCSKTQDPVVDSKPQLLTIPEQEFSRTKLLAQNVPWTCTPEDIRALFQKFGTVLDVELSMHNPTRNRGLAFVTMGSPEEADNALKNLESFEFQGRSLKMNYAKLRRKKPSSPPSFKSAPTFNLFVSNLPFEAKAEDIEAFFDAQGAKVLSAQVVYNDNSTRPTGYGFVAFKTKKEAEDALSTFAGKELMGRPLRIERSRQFVRESRKEIVQADDSSTQLDSKLDQTD